jgi:hypothetical protein
MNSAENTFNLKIIIGKLPTLLFCGIPPRKSDLVLAKKLNAVGVEIFWEAYLLIYSFDLVLT